MNSTAGDSAKLFVQSTGVVACGEILSYTKSKGGRQKRGGKKKKGRRFYLVEQRLQGFYLEWLKEQSAGERRSIQ